MENLTKEKLEAEKKLLDGAIVMPIYFEQDAFLFSDILDSMGATYFGRDFTFKKAPGGLKSVRLDRTPDGWRLDLTTEVGTFALPVGCGSWKTGEMRFTDRKFQALGQYVGPQRVAASGAVLGDGTVAVRIHMLAGPRRIDLRFRKKLFKPVVEGQVLGLGTFRSEW